MTQQMPGAMTRQQQMEAAAQQDPLLRLFLDIGKDRQRLRQVVEPSSKMVMIEVTETVASYVEELAALMVQVRNWVTESLADVDQRLTEVESSVDEFGSPDLSPELVNKIVRVCGESSALAMATLEAAPKADEESKKKLSDLIVLCAEVVDELGDDDEDEGEDEDDEEAAEAEG